MPAKQYAKARASYRARARFLQGLMGIAPDAAERLSVKGGKNSPASKPPAPKPARAGKQASAAESGETV
jgi:hypothetical protein